MKPHEFHMGNILASEVIRKYQDPKLTETSRSPLKSLEVIHKVIHKDLHKVIPEISREKTEVT